MKFETLLLNFDPAPGDRCRPANTPIYQTATFRQDSATSFGDFDYTPQRQSDARRARNAVGAARIRDSRFLFFHRTRRHHGGDAAAEAGRTDSGLRRSLRRHLSPLLAHSCEPRHHGAVCRLRRRERVEGRVHAGGEAGLSRIADEPAAAYPRPRACRRRSPTSTGRGYAWTTAPCRRICSGRSSWAAIS